MIIRNAIVHSIQKDRHQRPVLQLRNEILPIDNYLTELMESLRKLYNERTARGYGNFNTDTVNYPFSTTLRDYHENGGDFVDFSHTAMQILQVKISTAQLATGGYILFTHYQDNENDNLIVASIKHRPGLAFDADLNLTGAMHIDLERLHEMARVDVTSWLREGESYLSFAKRRSGDDGFSDYFRDFIGCQEIANSSEMNRLTLRAVRAFGANRGLDSDGIRNLRAVVYNYFEEKKSAREPVSLSMLSQRIDEDEPDAFLTFINESPETYPICDGFDPVRSEYKKLKTFLMKTGTVKIQFDQDDLGTRIILNEDGTLLVRDVRDDFVEELREFNDG